MRSPTLLPIRMNAADTSASSAIADWTPLTVVSRSCTTEEIDTFMIDVSTTSTNIAMASKTARRMFRGDLSEAGTTSPSGTSLTSSCVTSALAVFALAADRQFLQCPPTSDHVIHPWGVISPGPGAPTFYGVGVGTQSSGGTTLWQTCRPQSRTLSPR